jgi:predicted small lipoprotein YifL
MSGAHLDRFRIWAALAAAFLIFSAVSCGKKGPPVPPREIKPAPAVNLEVVHQDNVLILQWQLPEDWKTDYGQPDGFFVQRAQTPADDDCPECPVRFEQIGRVDYQHGRSVVEKWQFFDNASPGAIHRYRIVSFGQKGGRAAPSNTAVFTPGGDNGA